MKKHGNPLTRQDISYTRMNRIANIFLVFFGLLIATTKLDAQELSSFERFKSANRTKDVMPFRDILPNSLPAPYTNARVIIQVYGNHCNEYMIIPAGVDTKGFRLIPFKHFPTMDAYKVVGNSYPSLANMAAFSPSFDPFSHKAFRTGSAISVMSCGGRVDSPELGKVVNQSPRAILPDGRKAFLVNGFFNKWRSWCVFDDERSRAERSIPQSAFICVSTYSKDTTALEVLRSIVSYSGNPGR